MKFAILSVFLFALILTVLSQPIEAKANKDAFLKYFEQMINNTVRVLDVVQKGLLKDGDPDEADNVDFGKKRIGSDLFRSDLMDAIDFIFKYQNVYWNDEDLKRDPSRPNKDQMDFLLGQFDTLIKLLTKTKEGLLKDGKSHESDEAQKHYLNILNKNLPFMEYAFDFLRKYRKYWDNQL